MMLYIYKLCHQIDNIIMCVCSMLLLQGGWEDDESIDEAACREAFEEAGVKGLISVGALLDLLDLDVAMFSGLFIS